MSLCFFSNLIAATEIKLCLILLCFLTICKQKIHLFWKTQVDDTWSFLVKILILPTQQYFFLFVVGEAFLAGIYNFLWGILEVLYIILLFIKVSSVNKYCPYWFPLWNRVKHSNVLNKINTWFCVGQLALFWFMSHLYTYYTHKFGSCFWKNWEVKYK